MRKLSKITDQEIKDYAAIKDHEKSIISALKEKRDILKHIFEKNKIIKVTGSV